MPRSFNQLPRESACHGSGLTDCVNQYPLNALVLINGGKLRLVGYPSVILGPDLMGDKLHGPMGIETTFQSFVKQWIKLPGES